MHQVETSDMCKAQSQEAGPLGKNRAATTWLMSALLTEVMDPYRCTLAVTWR